MKYLLPLAALTLFAQGYCAEKLDDRVSKLETDMKIVRTETAFGNYGAKTASANPQNDRYGFLLPEIFCGGNYMKAEMNMRLSAKPLQKAPSMAK